MKYKVKKSGIQTPETGTKRHMAGDIIELDPDKPFTKAMLMSHFIEPVKGEKAGGSQTDGKTGKRGRPKNV